MQWVSRQPWIFRRQFAVGPEMLSAQSVFLNLDSVDTFAQVRINGKLAVVGNTTFLWKVLRMPMEFFSQRMAAPHCTAA